MSSYFDFVIERKNDKNKWVCVGKSYYDDNLDIINPWILKGAFWDAEYSSTVTYDNESELTDESFHMATYKIRGRCKGEPYILYKNENENILSFLEKITKSRYRCNDVGLWFNKDYICDNKDFLKQYLDCGTTDLTKYQDFQNKIDSAVDKSDFDDIFKECINIYSNTSDSNSSEVGIILNESSYELSQYIKYTPNFKDLKIEHVGIINYTNDKNEIIKQYALNGKISYKDDIERMIFDIDKTIEKMNKTEQAEELAKKFIYDILCEYDEVDDKDIVESELYQRLYEYTKDSDYDEYYDNSDELKEQKYNLELMLKFMGDNGRVIWNID